MVQYISLSATLLFLSFSSVSFSQSQIVVDGCFGLNNEVFTQAEDVGSCNCYESSSGVLFWSSSVIFGHKYNSSITDCALATPTTSGNAIANGPLCDIFQNSPQFACSIQIYNPVPTMSEWALIILGLVLSVFGLVAIRTRVTAL